MEKYEIQLRGLNEFLFCERLFHLEYAEGIFEENAETITGNMHHSKREKISGNNKIENVNVFEMILYAMDGVLSGKLDGIIEIGEEYVPIEDKNSKRPDKEFNVILGGIAVKSEAWINDFIQVVGEMYLLRKNGYKCNRGRIYYRGSNNMVDIEYQVEYDAIIEKVVEGCIENLKNSIPNCLVDSEKCVRCSLNWVCLPDEINIMNRKTVETRRLYPGRPDGSVLYVVKVGSKISKSGECYIVHTPDEEKRTIPIKDVEHICLFGNVQITTQALIELVNNGGAVFYFTSGGWFQAMTYAPITKNINQRIKQFEKFSDELFCLKVTQKLVIAKISNQRTLLRRNKKMDINNELMALKKYINSIEKCTDRDSVRGYEGISAKLYWETYPKILGTDNGNWKMQGRNRRPPKDAINAMLSYGYSLLLRDCISAISQTGMDYLLGVYHIVQPGRPAFALDIMEPYRPIIVDSLVLRLINEKIVKNDDFINIKAGIFMKPTAKKKLIYMYEKRMDEMITHPTFGYRLSYRRMIALEAKLLGKFIVGEIDEYSPLVTR